MSAFALPYPHSFVGALNYCESTGGKSPDIPPQSFNLKVFTSKLGIPDLHI